MLPRRLRSTLSLTLRRPSTPAGLPRGLCSAVDKRNGSGVEVPDDDRAKQKIAIAFTCTHARENCHTPEGERRTRKVFSRLAYEDGVVLVKCPCEKLHLIADNLGWFGEETNIEQILKQRGEDVTKMAIADQINIV